MNGYRCDPNHADADEYGLVPTLVRPYCDMVIADQSGIDAGDTRHFRVIAKSDGSESATGAVASVTTNGPGQGG